MNVLSVIDFKEGKHVRILYYNSLAVNILRISRI